MERIPTEVLGMVAEQLLRADLKSFSLVSKRIHAVSVWYLQNLVTIRAPNEIKLYELNIDELEDSHIHRISELRFAAPFRFIHRDRCPHSHSDGEEDHNSGSEGEGLDVSFSFNFGQLEGETYLILDEFEENKLRSFSWDMGCCVPEKIFGKKGILERKHPLLESLRLITDPACYSHEYDLAPFRNLKSFCWKGPHNKCHDLIDTAIKNNAYHLENLELDLLDWWKKPPGINIYDRSHEGKGDNSGYFGNTLTLNEHPIQPMFQTLTSLVLAHAPLGPAMVGMINFEALRSLTLRLCPGWGAFTQRIVKMELPVKLKTFELHHSLEVPVDHLPIQVEGLGTFYYSSSPATPGQSEVEKFIDFCGGLEELFLNLPEPVEARSLWKHITYHEASLKRLVLHHTWHYHDQWHFVEVHDLQSLGLADKGDTLYYPPSPNPLEELKLECIGLSSYPELAELMLETSLSLSSLRFIHIRSTGLGFEPFNRMSTRDYKPQISPPLLLFAEWAFGPEGPPLLEAIAYGDFAHGGTAHMENLILCPTRDWFRPLHMVDGKWRVIFRKYRNVLEACPTKPLLKV